MTKGKKVSKVIVSVLAMLVWTLTSTMASQIVTGYLMMWILGRDVFLQPVPTAIYSALSYVVAMFLIILVPAKLSKKWKLTKKGKNNAKTDQSQKNEMESSREDLGLRSLPTWTDIGLAPVGFIVYFLLAAGLTAVFTTFPWFDAGQTQDVGFSIYVSGVDRMVAFFTLVVVAPIAEEVIFRGWLYGKMRNKLSECVSNVASMILSILLVSLLFGLVHWQWNVGVNVFAMSVVMCGLREITGTIYAGILLHILKNGIAFYLLYVLGMG